MMGRQTGDQAGLFYEFRLADRIPKDHLLRRINVVVGPVLDGMRGQLKPYYSQIGRPWIDPELMIRMLIVGYCFGLRSERRLTQEVELHLAYRWFCRLDLDDKVPHHSTFSENRLNRFRKSDVFRHLYVSEDNLVRAVDAFVEGLDLGKLGFSRVVPLERGRPSYHPATLLKIYIYGYLNRVPSSRRL